MCSVSVVTVVFIHTMEEDQRLNTLVHEGDTLHFSLTSQEAVLERFWCPHKHHKNPRSIFLRLQISLQTTYRLGILVAKIPFHVKPY